MRNMQLLLRGIEHDSADAPSTPGNRALRMLSRATVVVGGIILCLGFAIASVWRAWEFADWYIFWFSLLCALVVALVPLLLHAITLDATKRLEMVGPLILIAAQSADERLAPLATSQPSMERATDFHAGEHRLGQLRGAQTLPMTVMGGALAPVYVFLLLLVLFPLALGVVFSGPSGPTAGYGDLLPILAGLGAVLWIAWLALLGLIARSDVLRRHITVAVSQQGIRWRQRGPFARSGQADWGAIRSILLVNSPTLSHPSLTQMPLTRGERTTYVIDAGEVQLRWTIMSAASDEEFEASRTLLALAVVRTGLPVRDLTVLATDLAQSEGHVARILSARIPDADAAPATRFVAAIRARAAAASDTVRRARRRAFAPAAAVALALVLLMAVGIVLERYQVDYFATLPAQVHQEGPLYMDSLANYAGAWPVQDPTPDNPVHTWFADDGYRATGVSARFLYAVVYGNYGNAAVEATVRQLGTATNIESTDGVGIVLHVHGYPLDMATFFVTTDGRFMLTHPFGYGNRILAIGRSDAIHTGVGATNRLLVVVRNGLYLCYVNDQLVTSYVDTFGATMPASGGVGVYVNDGSTTGVFTNFAVYALRPVTSPSLSFV